MGLFVGDPYATRGEFLRILCTRANPMRSVMKNGNNSRCQPEVRLFTDTSKLGHKARIERGADYLVAAIF